MNSTKPNILLTPREPDRAMLDAARDWSVKKYGLGIGSDAAIGCWQAMFDAAQPADADLAAAGMLEKAFDRPAERDRGEVLREWLEARRPIQRFMATATEAQAIYPDDEDGEYVLYADHLARLPNAGMTWRAQGEANQYSVSLAGDWLLAVQVNGELLVEQQRALLTAIFGQEARP